MTTHYMYLLLQNKKIAYFAFFACLVIVTGLNVMSDYFFALTQNSGFFISESLLFSSFWLLFVPLLYLQWYMVYTIKKHILRIATAAGMVLLHLLLYPLLVGGLSKVFLSHSFAYPQTFNYGITAYLIKAVIIYGFATVAYLILKKDISKSPHITSVLPETGTEPYCGVNAIIVTDNNNKKIVIPAHDIYCISASTPYVYIHHSGKKHLHTGTLKSLENQLGNNLFVRIHKSVIVNVGKVTNFQSRHNGDYDITLTDNNQLRVSRIYAKKFKDKLEECHRVKV